MLPRVGGRTRWATFDCYGTLVDWNAGIRAELERLIPGEDAERLLERYHEVERRVQRERPEARYRDVMAAGLKELAAEAGASLPESERDALGSSLPGWPIFPEVPVALAEARQRGWRLAVLTNSDRDLIDASLDVIGVPCDATVVASEIGSYKPAHPHWHALYQATGADPRAARPERAGGRPGRAGARALSEQAAPKAAAERRVSTPHGNEVDARFSRARPEPAYSAPSSPSRGGGPLRRMIFVSVSAAPRRIRSVRSSTSSSAVSRQATRSW